MIARLVSPISAIALLFTASLNAQESKAKAESPKARVNRQFAAHAPTLGSLLPDIKVYDAHGKKLPLRSLKGGHKVIVFGCLT